MKKLQGIILTLVAAVAIAVNAENDQAYGQDESAQEFLHLENKDLEGLYDSEV